MSYHKRAILALLGLAERGDTAEDALAAHVEATKITSLLEEYMGELRTRMFAFAEQQGIKDGKGSYTLRLANGLWFKKEARTSVKVNVEKAKLLGEDKNLPLVTQKPTVKKGFEEDAAKVVAKYAADLVEYQMAVDEGLLESSYACGQLSDEELASIVDRNVTYALKKGGEYYGKEEVHC